MDRRASPLLNPASTEIISFSSKLRTPYSRIIFSKPGCRSLYLFFVPPQPDPDLMLSLFPVKTTYFSSQFSFLPRGAAGTFRGSIPYSSVFNDLQRPFFSTFLCFNVPSFQRPFFSTFLCFNVRMLQRPPIPPLFPFPIPYSPSQHSSLAFSLIAGNIINA